MSIFGFKQQMDGLIETARVTERLKIAGQLADYANKIARRSIEFSAAAKDAADVSDTLTANRGLCAAQQLVDVSNELIAMSQEMMK